MRVPRTTPGGGALPCILPRMTGRVLRALVSLATLAIAAHGTAAPIPPPPIPDGFLASPGATAPSFLGQPGIGTRVRAAAVPRHRFMARNGKSNVHDDAFMTDTYTKKGPVGNAMARTSRFTGGGVCGTVTFDTRGRILTVCIVDGGVTPFLKLLDAKTLGELGSLRLPPRPTSQNVYQDFTGGGYFYLDRKSRAVLFTADHHVSVVAITGGTSGPAAIRVHADYDLSAVVASEDKAVSLLPDWAGRIWFVTLQGTIGVIGPESGQVRTLTLGEEIENSFAVDDGGGVFIVSDVALYRLDADSTGAPSITWREVYQNTGIIKPGQVNAGSGTTPTLLGDDWVAITDNADPMNVVVYRRQREVVGSRLGCEQPVFTAGASATENSLIGAGRSLIVENNYGYTDPFVTTGGGSTSAGIERVDIDDDGEGCQLVWHSDEHAPTVVPKLSLKSGLIYTYSKDPEPGPNYADAWYLTAIDFATGETRWRQLVGTGLWYNNNYAPITLGPDGSVYSGVLGGLVKLRDTRR